jgi:2-methylcitrate dehydratase PrpD
MTFGAFGSIATAGRLMGFDRERMARAMGYAAHMAMGLAEGGLSTGPVTHYYSLVCRNGIIGASICETGGGCSPHVLEGRFGFLETFFGSAAFDRDGLAASLGHDHQVLSACEKRYPGTALNQVPIELLRAMVADHGLTAAMVERVRIEIPQERANFDAGHFMGPFTNRGSATSSVAFQLAIVLLDGDIVAARYDQPSDPAVADIVARMEIALVREKPIRYARLTIETTDGRTFCREGETFQFPPEPPRVVLHREAEGLLPRERIDRFADLLETLEELDDASQLTRCLAL